MAAYRTLPFRPSGTGGGTSNVSALLRLIRGEEEGNPLAPGDTSNATLFGVRLGGDGRKLRRPSLQEPPETAATLLEQLFGMVGGGSSRSAVRAATAPYRAGIQEVMRQIGQSQAQTAQNQADITSWFGQAGDMYRSNARVAKRSTKKAAKGAKRLSRGLLEGMADPNVARALASQGTRDIRHIAATGANEANFQRAQAADTSRQASYERMVQARLGAQQTADLQAQIPLLRAQKMQAREQARSENDPLENLLNVLQVLPEDLRIQVLTGQAPAAEGGFGLQEGSALQSALGNVQAFRSEDQGGAPTDTFNGLLRRMYAAAEARGLNVNDPEVRNAIQQYIQANIVPGYNQMMGTSYALRGGQFGGGR